MKQFIITGLMVILAIASTYAQTKHDNVIVANYLTYKEAMLKCLDMGYNIAVKDDDLQYFSTTPRADKHHNEVVYHVRIKDSIAVITGDLNQNMGMALGMWTAKVPITQIEFRGEEGSPMKQSWYSMNDFAKSFGKQISYASIR